VSGFFLEKSGNFSKMIFFKKNKEKMVTIAAVDSWWSMGGPASNAPDPRGQAPTILCHYYNYKSQKWMAR
jgi:hypothetical protein